MTSRLRGSLAASVLAASALGACDATLSDNATFQRHRRAERARRIDGMRSATAQTRTGTRLEGEALRALLTGRTHVSVFERTPSGRKARYVERRHYGSDGRFIYVNSEWATDPGGNPADRWRVDGSRLCVLNHALSRDEHCYTVALTPEGHVQFFIDEPGSDAHGLLTSVVRTIEDAPPQ